MARGTVRAIIEAWAVGTAVRIVAHCPVSTVARSAGAAMLARTLVVAVSVGVAVVLTVLAREYLTARVSTECVACAAGTVV